MFKTKSIKDFLFKKRIAEFIIPIFLLILISIIIFFRFYFRENLNLYSTLTFLLSKDYSYSTIQTLRVENKRYLKSCTILHYNVFTNNYAILYSDNPELKIPEEIKIVESSGYYRSNYHFFFYSRIALNYYIILIIPFTTFYFYSQYLLYYIVFAFIFIFIIYFILSIKEYKNFKYIILNLYFLLKSLSTRNAEKLEIEKLNIDEIDLLIERIKRVYQEFNEKINFFINRTEFLKQIIYEIPIPVLFFDEIGILTDYNKAGKFFLFDILNNKNSEDLNSSQNIEKNNFYKNNKPYYQNLSISKENNNNKIEPNFLQNEINFNDIEKLFNKQVFYEIDGKNLKAIIIFNDKNLLKLYVVTDLILKLINFDDKETSLIFDEEKKQNAIKLISDIFKNNSIFYETKSQLLRLSYIGSLAHELRTPLNTIIGFSDLIINGIEGNISEEVLEDVKYILSSAKKLLVLLDEVIYISRIYNFEKLYKRKVLFNLKEYKEILKSILSGFVKILNFELFLIINKNIEDIIIEADQENLSHIFVNIIIFLINSIEEIKNIELKFDISEKNLYIIISPNNKKDEYSLLEFSKFLKYFEPELHSKLINENINLSNAKKISELIEAKFFIIKKDNRLYFLIEYPDVAKQ